MKLKTYRSKSMAAALAAVKRDLGSEAVILHTRQQKTGGLFGIGARTVVEVTAADGPTIARIRTGARREAPPMSRPRPANPDPLRDLLEASEIRPNNQRVEPRIDSSEPKPAPASADKAEEMIVRQTGAAPVHDEHASLERDIESIKRMVGRMMQSAARPTEGRATDALARHYLALLENDVAAEIVEEIVGEIRDDLTPRELADPAAVRHAVLQRLAALVPVSADAPNLTGEGGGPLKIALVGPTGVGKTTTVAKLAATYKLRHGRRVGLITSDTYRIAAVDQLRTYAGIIGVPLRVVASADDAAPALESLSNCDVILIDTAGRSPRDGQRIVELEQLLSSVRPDQTHLVLSGTSSEGAILAAAREFARVKPDRMILTKLDEAANFGVLLNVARRLQIKLSYVTTGQEVPDHLEPGRADRLARMALDGAAHL